MNKIKLTLLAGLLASMLALISCQPSVTYVAKDITESHFKKDYELNDLDEKVKTPKSFKGKVTALYFGYTYCPDACPNTLWKLNEVKQLLGDDADIFQVVFVTVDPQRDTPQKLRDYASNFPNLDLIILRPNDYQLRDLKVKYRIEMTKVPGVIIPEDYTIDHMTSIILFDKSGRARRGALYDQTAEELVEDIKNLSKL